MVESFEEFLKNNQQIWIFCTDCGVIIDADNADDHKKCKIDNRTIIELKDLGEWAWATFVSIAKEYKDVNWAIEHRKLWKAGDYEIALACLGEAEVKKRLKELNKKVEA